MRLKRYIEEQDYTTILGDPIEGQGEKSDPSSRFINTILYEAIPRIKRECHPILTLMKKSKRFLWRGLKYDDDYVLLTPRTDRKPTDTPKRLHEAFDDLYYKKYKWRPRKEGVFVSNKERGTEGYGIKYVIFPVGNFGYTWCEGIPDFYIYARRTFSKTDKDEYINEKMQEIVDSYLNNREIGRWWGHPRNIEMIIRCKKYYAINYEFVEGATAKYPGFESDFQNKLFE